MQNTPPTHIAAYSPLYFLAALGAGGLAVTFFMYLMFWVPHPDKPVPVFEDIAAAYSSGPAAQFAIVAALVGIAFFALMNIRLMVWNVKRYWQFRKSGGFVTFATSNAETQQLAFPLAIAMTINVLFIVGLVFVPGLWSVTEYLFPAALLAFGLVGALALKMIGAFLGRALSSGGGFDFAAHNSFAQLLPAFALSMVAVGFAAPAAMSAVPATVAVSLVGSTFFGVAAAIYALFAAITAVAAMLQFGTAREAAPTLLIVIPLMTVLGIITLRQNHGLHHTFDAHSAAVDNLMLLSQILSVQIVFLLFGVTLLRRLGYLGEFVFGHKTSPGAYALVCPGVALSVMLHFWINKGLVGAGVLEKFSFAYWSLTGIALALQVLMIALVLYLNRRHFPKALSGKPQPAQ